MYAWFAMKLIIRKIPQQQKVDLNTVVFIFFELTIHTV